MVNHGLTTGALFACVGVIYERYHTRDMGELGGLWNRLPLWAFFIILAAMGSAALPGLNGFVGEFPILLGMFRTRPTFAVLASLGMILGAYYLLVMLQKVVFGPLKEPTGPSVTGITTGPRRGHGPRRDSPGRLARDRRPDPLMVLIVLIGIYPKPFLDRIQPPLVADRGRVASEDRGWPDAVLAKVAPQLPTPMVPTPPRQRPARTR